MAITSSQITIIDYNDITTSITPPQNPTLDQLWLDTSINPSILKRYNGSLWINSGIDLNDYPSVTGTISKVNLGLNINGEVIKTINANNLNITTPSSDGLYLTKDYIGFYKTSDMQWKSYIKSDGTFKFYGNSTNFVEWNGSSLTIRGLLNAGDIITGTLSADRIESNSLTVDKLNVGSGAVFSGNIFSGKTVTGSGGSTSELTNGTREIGSNLYTFSSGNSINNAPESAYIQIDLGEVCRLSQINTYWYSGDNRYYLYKIKYSTDGTSWIYAKGNSSNTGWVLSTVPISTDTGKINPTIDIFNIPISARYIRIFGNGNSVNTLNNLYEIEGFSTEQTSIVGDQISSGIIQSNNYNTTLGSYFNLNNGTFKLGGSLKPKLSWDGTDLNITGKINVLSGSNIEPGATSNYRYIQTDDPLPEQITFIRNSTAYSSDFKSVPNNKPRIENGIFGKAIMIEEGVTNLCPYSRAMDQWSYARCSVVLNAAKSFDSTLSANKIICDGNNDPSVWITKDFGSQIKNRTFTFSVFLWTDSGQPTEVTLFMYDFFSNPFSRKYELFQITTTPKRYSITYTMPSDAIGNIILFRIDPKDISPGAGSYIYADGIQIEEKPYATSFHESIRNPESITIPSDGITPYAGTIEMWLDVTDQTKRATIGNSSHRLIHIGRANDNNANGLVIGQDDNGFAAGLFNDSGVASSVAPIPNNSVLNGRHHFAVAWDATSLIFYIDGVQKGIINTPQLPTGFSPLIHIGCHPTSSTAFINSLIDNVRLSNYKRAEADILASATSGLPMKKDLFTVALLNFDTGIEWLNNGVLKTYNGVGWEDTATWGASWNSNIKDIPNRFKDTPLDNDPSGLYLSSNRMGYWDTTTNTFKTYIDANGSFYFAGNDSNNFIQWDGTSNRITIRGLLNADDITAGTISANRIGTSSVTADKIGTGTLSASQDITVGGIVISSGSGTDNGNIRLGKTSYSNNNPGFFLGQESGISKFNIGDVSKYIKWDGSSLNIAGSINVLAGSNIQPGATSNKTFNQSSDPILYHPTFTRDTTSYKMNGTLILNNKPRIESGLFGGAIMIEEGVVNLFTSPNNLSDAIWIKTGNNTPVLDNTIIPTNTNIQHYFYQDKTTTSGKQYTISFECKSSGYNFVQITGSTGFPTAVVNIDISAASIVWNPNAESKIRVDKTQDGWCRIEYTLTSNSSSLSRMIVAVINNNNQLRLPTWTGDGISGVKFRNMQFEQNLIATSFHESTRNSEILTIPTNGVTPSAGTIEMWIYINDKTKITDYTNSRIVFIAGETVGYGGYIALMHDKNTPYWYMAARKQATGTLTISSMIADSTTPTGWNHFAVTWDSINGARLYINGIDTGATIAASSMPNSFGNGTFEIGQISNSTIRHINTLFDSICLSNYKKTQAELLESATSGLPISRNSGTVGLYEFDNHISWIDGSTLRAYNGVSWDSAATIGAIAGTNLKNENGTVLGNVDILNSSSAYSVLSVPLDAELFSFNNNITGSKGTSPTGTTNVYTRRYAEDNFGYNCIAIESPTTNLLLNSMMASTANWMPSNSGNLLLSTSSPLGSLPIGATGCLRTVVTGAMGYTTQAVTLSTSTQYTLSAWVFVPSYVVGTASISVWYSNSGWYNIAATTITERNVWVRKTLTFTSNSSFTSHIIGFGIGTGSVNDCVYVSMPQLEQKPFATSYTQSTRSDGRIIYSGLENDINWEKFSALMWIKRQYTGASQRIFSSWTKALFTVDVTTNILRYSYTNTSQQNVNSSLTLTDTNWHLVGLSVDKTNNKITFFKDDLFDEKTGVTIGYTAAATPFTLGQLTSTDVSTPANMLFSNFVIFKNSVITTDYVKAVYAAQKPFYDLNNIIKVPKPSSVSITIGVA